MSSNYCIECGVDMGPSNPRQLCCKSYCDKSFYNDDKSICLDDKSICLDDKGVCLDDKGVCLDDKGVGNDDKSVYNDDKSVYNDDNSFYEPDAVAQDEPSPFNSHSPVEYRELGESEFITATTYNKYRNEHNKEISRLEATVAHLEKQVKLLTKAISSL